MNIQTIQINGKFSNQIQIYGPYKFTHINQPLYWVNYTDNNYCIILDNSEIQQMITYYKSYVETLYKPQNIISEIEIENVIKNCGVCSQVVKNCGPGKSKLMENTIIIKNCMHCKNMTRNCVTCRELIAFLNAEPCEMHVEYKNSFSFNVY